MPQRSIGAQVQIISPVAGFDVFGQNYGNSIIYVSSNPSVSPTSFDQVLTPSSTIDWPANKGALYLATDPGAQALFNYSTDGTRVTGSSVTISSGSVVTNSANAPVLLYQMQQQLLGTVGRQAFGPFIPLDISNYASILITINNYWGGTFIPANYFDVNPRQSTDFLTNSPISQLAAQWTVDSTSPVSNFIGSIMSYQVPVTNSKLFCVLGVNVATAFAVPINSPVTLSIYGTHETLTSPRYVGAGQQMLGTAAYGGTLAASTAVGVNTTFQTQHKNGLAQISAVTLTDATQCTIYVNVLQDGVQSSLAIFQTNSGGFIPPAQFILPALPVNINIRPTVSNNVALLFVQ